MIKKQHIFFLFSISIALGLSGWYYSQPQPAYTLSPQELEQLPDAVATAIHAKQYDRSGNVANELQAKRIVHYPQDNSSYLDSPELITTNQQDAKPWQINAKHGRLLHGTDTIILWDDVRIMQQDEEKTNTLITTTTLTYHSTTEEAYTDQPVQLYQTGILITSQGMHAYLDKEQVILLEKARGSFDHTDGQITVSADYADLNYQTGIGEYHGNVIFQQGVTELIANHAITELDDKQKLKNASAFGDEQQPAIYRSQNELGDHLLGEAESIHYASDSQKILLEGNAMVKHNENLYTAPSIQYDMIEERVLSPQTSSGRTEIIIHTE